MWTIERVPGASFMTHLLGPLLTGLKVSERRTLSPSLTLPAGTAKIDPVMSYERTANRHDDRRGATRVAVHFSHDDLFEVSSNIFADTLLVLGCQQKRSYFFDYDLLGTSSASCLMAVSILSSGSFALTV
jgi:hypothetical protein